MLEFKNVCKTFENFVVENISFKIRKGERLAISGESGIGKTTIINLILGIIQPDKGKIINDFDRISTVFQENRLIEEVSALKNLKMVTEKPDGELIRLLLDLKVEDFIEPVKNLSGGTKRRVAIARALVYEADLYLLDEPIQGLDEGTRHIVIEKILEVARGKSIILVSHNRDDMRDFKICTEIAL